MSGHAADAEQVEAQIVAVLAEHEKYEWWPMTREFICTCEASIGTSYPDAAHRTHVAANLARLIAEAERRTWGIAAGQFMQRGLDEAARIAFDTADALRIEAQS